MRAAVAGILQPDHKLAQFIRTECSNGDWAGIIVRIWPNTKSSASTGEDAETVGDIEEDLVEEAKP